MEMLKDLEFSNIPAGSYELGWRFTSQLPKPALDVIKAEFDTVEEFLTRYSSNRTIVIASFSIATTTVSLGEILGYEYEDVSTIPEVCDKLDTVLIPHGLRVPTEDEMEIACGGELFTWGMTIPEGEPYGPNAFTQHAGANSRGLQLSGNTYEPELTRDAFKLGDGGSAVCGGDSWPRAWLTLCPSHRLVDSDIEEYFGASMECACIRPVRLN